MSAFRLPSETPSPTQNPPLAPAKPRMSTRNRLLFFATGWLIVLMPFLFWWNTWFGRQLSDKQLAEYLQDDKKPRHIQHALVQIGERVARHDAECHALVSGCGSPGVLPDRGSPQHRCLGHGPGRQQQRRSQRGISRRRF